MKIELLLPYLFYTSILLAAINNYFQVAGHFNIIDKPNNRNSHSRLVLRGGGIIYGVDTSLTILYRLIRRENIIEPHRQHLYQLLTNEAGISHVKVSTGYTVAQLLINLFIIALAGQVALGYQLVVSVGITGTLAALYIYVKGNLITVTHDA